MMNRNMLAVAVAAMLVGGVAVAAYNSLHSTAPHGEVAGSAITQTGVEATFDASADDRRTDGGVGPAARAQTGRLAYADVVDVAEVTQQQERFATVTAVDAVSESHTASTPRQVCEDVVVQERAPERDGNVGGTVAGAVIGGVLGNQIGKGNGRKAATAAGAVAGGFVGHRVDRNHVGGQIVQRVDTRCRTVSDTSRSSRVVGYDVAYRTPDGTTGRKRMDNNPGERISLGSHDEVVGYDVTYRYDGQERTVRLSERPDERLPVLDGEVLVRTAPVAPTPRS